MTILFIVVVLQCAASCAIIVTQRRRIAILQQHIDFLKSRPLSYWQMREANRKMMEVALEKIGDLKAFALPPKIIEPTGDTVKFRRPVPFDKGWME